MCTCNGCKITNSGYGYQPCHNNNTTVLKPPGPR